VVTFTFTKIITMQRLYIFVLAVALYSCQKELHVNNKLDSVTRTLRDSLPPELFKQVDFTRQVRSIGNNNKIDLLRVGIKDKNFENSFVLLKWNSEGVVSEGRIMNVGHNVVSIQYLNGTQVRTDTLINGFRSFSSSWRQSSQADPYQELPEVIVSASYNNTNSGSAFSGVALYNLISFFNDAVGGGSGEGWYGSGNPFSGGNGGGGGGGGGATDPNPVIDPMMQIEFEFPESIESIDILKFMHCFDLIPDAGAMCKLTLFTDVPVNGDPSRMFDWNTGSPGHTFLRFSKVNGTQSASQVIGFYPVQGWKTVTSAVPVEGKFGNDGGHEFNASYEISASPGNFHTAVMEAVGRRTMQYSIDNNNCTDFALQVLKTALAPSLWLNVPQFQIPGSVSPGSNTPQGVYSSLVALKAAGRPGVTIPVIGWSGASDGPCN
jgi:hypothetical protein